MSQPCGFHSHLVLDSFLRNIPAQMSWMRLASGFAFCVLSSWCCDDAEFTKVMQHNDQLKRAVTELLQKLEALQMEELNRRMQESDVVCCPCSVTVGNTTIGPPLDPFWQVTSGDCVLEDDCLTSGNYPLNYFDNAACEIEITDEWVGYLDVHHFETEEYFDFLTVNNVEYSGTMSSSPFNGVIPSGTILWTSDYIVNKAGFKICRTNVSVTVTTTTVTTTTTIYQATNISNQSYNEFWGVTEGDCYMDTSGCIASPEYPQVYGDKHVCLIELTDLWDGASIDVIAFYTELDGDYLFVNDVGYSGDELHSRELQGMVPVTTIVWSAGRDTTGTGWKICREAAAPVEWANWTCTVLGDDCIRPFNNIYPNTSCSTLYSDPDDEDGDDLLHDGHPWCTAPSEHDYDERQPCGPCSCLAGEAQTYNSRVLHDNWNNFSYIVCTPCLPGTFKSVGGYGAADLCSSCSSGKHTGIHGATACDPCEAGRVAAIAGSALCTVCPLGRHAPQEGGLACETCGAGYYSAEDGSSVCEICAAGLYSLANASACEACDPGQSSAPGSDSCEGVRSRTLQWHSQCRFVLAV